MPRGERTKQRIMEKNGWTQEQYRDYMREIGSKGGTKTYESGKLAEVQIPKGSKGTERAIEAGRKGGLAKKLQSKARAS